MSRLTLFIAVLAAAALAPGLIVTQTEAQSLAPAGDPQRSSQKVQMLPGAATASVGWRTAHPQVYRVPKIAGQHPTYSRRRSQGLPRRPGAATRPWTRSPRRFRIEDMADIAAYYAQAPLQTAVK